jgi:hypothetical protein
MNTPVAYLIYATATASGFPAQAWNAIEYPSLQICQAKARELKRFVEKPDQVADRERKQVSIIFPPSCDTQRPPFWFEGRP